MSDERVWGTVVGAGRDLPGIIVWKGRDYSTSTRLRTLGLMPFYNNETSARFKVIRNNHE